MTCSGSLPVSNGASTLRPFTFLRRHNPSFSKRTKGQSKGRVDLIARRAGKSIAETRLNPKSGKALDGSARCANPLQQREIYVAVGLKAVAFLIRKNC
jgi:hypothetical protein